MDRKLVPLAKHRKDVETLAELKTKATDASKWLTDCQDEVRVRGCECVLSVCGFALSRQSRPMICVLNVVW